MLVRSSATIYRTFNFTQPWDTVRYADVCGRPGQGEDLRVVAALVNGKVPPLFPVIS